MKLEERKRLEHQPLPSPKHHQVENLRESAEGRSKKAKENFQQSERLGETLDSHEKEEGRRNRKSLTVLQRGRNFEADKRQQQGPLEIFREDDYPQERDPKKKRLDQVRTG